MKIIELLPHMTDSLSTIDYTTEYEVYCGPLTDKATSVHTSTWVNAYTPSTSSETRFRIKHNLGITDLSKVKYIGVTMIEDTYGIRVARSGDSQYAYMNRFCISGIPTRKTATMACFEFRHDYYNGQSNSYNYADITVVTVADQISLQFSGYDSSSNNYGHNYMAFRELPNLQIIIVYEE